MKLWIDVRTVAEGYIGAKSVKMMCNKNIQDIIF